MLSHIKDLLRQRKEGQQRRFFSNHFNRKAQPTVKPDMSDIHFHKNSIRQKKKQQQQQQQQQLQKKSSADNMTIVAMPETDKYAVHAADGLANRLVEADNKRRSQLPSYPGLERFKMIQKLGDGAFSNVYEALDLKTGRKVAIKVAQKSISDKNTSQRHLHSSIVKKPRVTERANILKEVQIMHSVRHPNIVQLIHYMESYENYFLTLDLCQGGEVFHRIVKLTYFSENLSRHVITQVALAVQHLHKECGVVHRDIKPENILFEPIPIIPSKHRVYRPTDNIETKEDEGEFIRGVGGGGIGKVKLADFGLSKVIWNSSTLTPCGTVGYTAPEIVCDKTYSKSVDMWAIGCVLYTMLCGFPPFYDESIPLLTEKVARGQYTYLSPWWDTISDSVKDLISHLLCVDVKNRYTIDQFLNHPWITEEPFIRNDDDACILTEKDIYQHIHPKDEKTDTAKIHQQEQQETLEAMVHQAVKSNLLTPPEIDQQELDPMMDDSSIVYTTPDAATLRSIFDITYAVQRMGEEQSLMDTHQAQEETSTHCNEKDHFVQVPSSQKSRNLYMAQKLALHSRGVADPVNYRHYQRPQDQNMPHHTAFGSNKNGFQLDLKNATLLKNRKINVHQDNTARKIKV